MSDADKLEALGTVGIDRCVEYTRVMNQDKSQAEQNRLVVKHADEKLLILHKYFYTTTGKAMAHTLTEEMTPIIDNMRRD